MQVQSLISPHVQALEPYEPPDWQALAALGKVGLGQLVRLDANENPYGLSPRAAEALARFQGYGYYPDYRALEAAVARHTGVEPGHIALGNGGDEIIDLAVRLFVEPGQGAIVCPPAFGLYATSTTAHRGRVFSVPRQADFSLDLEAIEALAAGEGRDGEQGGRGRPKLLFLTSPGNPDGQTISGDTMRRLLELPLAVVVDEAYVEFGGQSVVPLLEEYANLLVLRTFSKWAGMAALRLGYAVTSREIAGAMARLRPPYNVNAAAVVAALATFDDMDHVEDTIGRIVAERERLHSPARPTLCSAASTAVPDRSWGICWPGRASWCAASPIRRWRMPFGSRWASRSRTTRSSRPWGLCWRRKAQ